MFTSVAQANDAVIERIRNARPHWLDVKPAGSLIGALNQNKTLLHAGPPMRWQEMTGPMKGACIGACLFEGWAQDEKTAHAMLESGEITFIPCHHVNAVGPMGGITSPNMPMLVVENIAEGNRAYCNLNEGIGKVMRFGAYGEDVQQRLRWMRDVLMPVLSAALKQMERGIDLTAMMAQGITMGDEFHQRNIATSALLMRTLAPHLARLNHDKQQIAEVMDFLAITDQFFLNLAMAYCKAAMDSGAQIRAGSIVTAMTRNGDMFGIRVSGLGDRWFTAPVNTPQGLFFTGFSQEQANPDMGDSAITETFGIGDALLTLHHQGQGVSPGGWVLRHRDYAALRAGALPLARDSGIQVDSLLLSPPRRRCSLRPCYQPNGAYLPATLMNRPEETGLFGPLSQAIHLPQHPELRQLRHCFASALTGKAIDWRLWLGKGPGLTPSLDDMLIGMMLAAWCAGQMSRYGGRTFFRASGDLHATTTLVSVNYLRYASEGRFASPLMHFAHALQRRRRIEPAVETLLAMGHTSGADTLLGFWLAQHII